MKQEVREMWERIDPVSSKYRHIILKEGTITGSKVFGGMSESSDIDIIMPVKFRKMRMWSKLFEEQKLVYDFGEYEGEEFKSGYVKFKSSKRPINLLFMNDSSSELTWIWATEALIAIRQQHPITIKPYLKFKNERVALFEALKGIVRHHV